MLGPRQSPHLPVDILGVAFQSPSGEGSVPKIRYYFSLLQINYVTLDLAFLCV